MKAEREAATAAAATMMPVSLRQEYLDIPVVTRVYMTACILTTAAVELGLVSPFQLYFSPDHLVGRYQIWRMFTNFLYFGPLGLNFVLNMIFLYRYCRMLEEGSFRGRRADFVFMLWFTGLVMMLFSLCSNIPFLGQSFIIMLVYVWSRRNTQVRMNFFGLLNFRAPYLPCVLTGFSLLLGNSILIDVLGICVGHMYYYIEDVFPNQPEGWKLLITPDFLRALLDQPEDQEDQQQDEEQRQDGQQQDEEQRQDDELNH